MKIVPNLVDILDMKNDYFLLDVDGRSFVISNFDYTIDNNDYPAYHTLKITSYDIGIGEWVNGVVLNLSPNPKEFQIKVYKDNIETYVFQFSKACLKSVDCGVLNTLNYVSEYNLEFIFGEVSQVNSCEESYEIFCQK